MLVVVAGLAYWLLVPRMPSEIASYTAQQTSSLSSSMRTSQSSVSSTAATSASETTLWINVTGTKPVSYYLSQLKSTGTQPYVQLAWELQALPDATNATAVAKITYLALNASNPEIKEAFELMMKGGTPDPRDFTYTVPSWNTELQVLYWLACQNEFKKDDTLALAIAMVNGLWVTMGDSHVREAVKKDTSDLLTFFRETNELQKQAGYYQLEGYPLEAKLALAWTGGPTASPEGGPFSLPGNPPTPSWLPIDFTSQRIQLHQYRWDTVSIETLTSMRALMQRNGWIKETVPETVNSLDLYLFGNVWDIPGGHWNYLGSWDERIVIDSLLIAPRNFINVEFQYEYFVDHGRGIGVCADEAAFLDALLKSSGIATLPSGWEMYWNQALEGDGSVICYDPAARAWKGPEVRSTKWNGHPGTTPTAFSIFKPPVIQPGFLKWHKISTLPVFVANLRYTKIMSFQEMYDMLITGMKTADFKRALFYE